MYTRLPRHAMNCVPRNDVDKKEKPGSFLEEARRSES